MNFKAFMLGLLLTSVLLTGCFKITDANGDRIDLQKDSTGSMYFSQPAEIKEAYSFKAMVKGSIYETGELMSVFGTCLDGNDGAVLSSYAELSAWYPNGTQFIYDDNMTIIQPGYFVWQGNMTSVQGTYLTQMRCKMTIDPNITALAFGEWQNPYWVKRIALLNDSISDLNMNINNMIENKYRMYFRNVSSDIGGYLKMNATVPITPLAVEQFSGVTNNQLLYSFMSDPVGYFDQISRGPASVNMHVQQLAGTKDAYLYATLAIYNTNASETPICTTGIDSLILVNVTESTMFCDVPVDMILNSTDRIVTRIYAAAPGGGSSPTLQFYYDDSMGCGLDLPSIEPYVVNVNMTPVLDAIQEVNLTLNNLTVQVNNSFQITWDMINYTNYNINYSVQQLNQSIYYVASIANSSVDRNDSYLAQLLLNLTAWTQSGNLTGQPLDHVDEADYPVYWRIWNIKVTANAVGNVNKKVSWPDSQCYINTTLTPTLTAMTPQGSFFKYEERITTAAPFDWTVTCVYA